MLPEKAVSCRKYKTQLYSKKEKINDPDFALERCQSSRSLENAYIAKVTERAKGWKI